MDIGNTIVTAAVFASLAGGAAYYLRKRPDSDEEGPEMTFPSMTEYLKNSLHMQAYSEPEIGLSNDEYMKALERQSVLRRSLAQCPHGNIGAKRYVKGVMKTDLQRVYNFTDENIDKLIPFRRPDLLSVIDKWDILLYHFSRIKGREGFNHMVDKYKLCTLKNNEFDNFNYEVADEDIHEIFDAEQVELTISEKIDVVVQRLYQHLKGLSVIDELRDQNIDGVNGGTSGLPQEVADALDINDPSTAVLRNAPKACDAVWMLYKGRSVGLSFLSFGSENELQRVCQVIYAFGNPGQLNEANGYKVNDMADGSRVVVLRPKMAESWAFFVRKFDVSKIELDRLITDENCEIMIDAIKFQMKGVRTTLFTGQQGTGKTTLMSAAFKYLYGYYNLRIQEMAFELRLRKLMPEKRNILSLRTTATVSGQEGINVQKKTDGSINIIGEIADAETASHATQAGLVGSICTYASHHGKTASDAITALALNMVQTKQVGDIFEGLRLVLQVWKFNLNLVRNTQGHRYPDRLTEYIPLTNTVPYDRSFLKSETRAEREVGMWNSQVEYQERVTDRKLFDTQDVIYWKDGAFYAGPMYTDTNIREMWDYLLVDDKRAFKNFLKKWWPKEFARRGYEEKLRIVLSKEELEAREGRSA